MERITILNNEAYGDSMWYTESDRVAIIEALADGFGERVEEFTPGFMENENEVDLIAVYNDRDSNPHNLAGGWQDMSNSTDQMTTAARNVFDEFAAHVAPLDDVMTSAECADEFAIDDSTVRKAIERGNIPARQSGKTWLVLRRDAAEKWGKRGPREDWSDWRGPGWYAPRAEGEGWNIIRMYHLPWEYGESQYPADDKSTDTIHDVARFYNVGTPVYYAECPQD